MKHRRLSQLVAILAPTRLFKNFRKVKPIKQAFLIKEYDLVAVVAVPRMPSFARIIHTRMIGHRDGLTMTELERMNQARDRSMGFHHGSDCNSNDMHQVSGSSSVEIPPSRPNYLHHLQVMP